MGRNFFLRVILFFISACFLSTGLYGEAPAPEPAEIPVIETLSPQPAIETPSPEMPLPAAVGAGMPSAELEKILEQDMGGPQKTWGIRFKKRQENSSPLIGDIPWLNVSQLQRAGAYVLRGLLILAVAALVLAAVIYWYRHRERPWPVNRPSVVSRPNSAGPASPQALLEEAGRLYRQGFLREAWGRCYAAALEALRLRWGFRFPPGATEYRCLALVRLQKARFTGPAEPDQGLELSFAGLIRHWVAFFYGGIVPPEGAFEEALAWVGSLCGNSADKPAPAGAEGIHG